MPAPASALPTELTGYLAAEPYVAELRTELAQHGPLHAQHERLALLAGPPRVAAWALNVWHDPVVVRFCSVSEAARALRALGRRWVCYSWCSHRRAALIEQALPRTRVAPLRFPSPLPRVPLGSWTLLDAGTLLASARCSSPFPNGEPCFEEDHDAPPSRAYLKLWEAFTLLERHPKPGERCLDLGASPGGWTWAVRELGAEVLAVDKAPLDPRIAASPGVTVLRQSAFGLDPRRLGPFDWLLSDVICYPKVLLKLVRRWLDSGQVRNLLCTVKLQGPTDHEVIRELVSIPGSFLRHLHHNKHELTWALVRP